MPVNTYEVEIKGRLQNATVVDPTLPASVTSSTAFVDKVTVNGVEKDIRDMSAAELTTTKSVMKQAVLDMIDVPTFTQTGPTGGTANGTMTLVTVSKPLGVTETWTITSTSSTNFTVTGSVSGAAAAAVLANATAGTFVDYAHATLDAKGFPLVSFRLTQGSTAFHTGGATSFTIPVTAN